MSIMSKATNDLQEFFQSPNQFYRLILTKPITTKELQRLAEVLVQDTTFTALILDKR